MYGWARRTGFWPGKAHFTWSWRKLRRCCRVQQKRYEFGCSCTCTAPSTFDRKDRFTFVEKESTHVRDFTPRCSGCSTETLQYQFQLIACTSNTDFVLVSVSLHSTTSAVLSLLAKIVPWRLCCCDDRAAQVTPQ